MQVAALQQLNSEFIMDTTLTFDAVETSDAAQLVQLPIAAAQAFAGAGFGMLASGWLTLRAVTNMVAVASGTAALAGAMSAFRNHGGNGFTPSLRPLEHANTLGASETIAASEKLAEAWGAHLQVSPEAQLAARTADAEGNTETSNEVR